jgi:hypothetical protein
MPSQLLRVIQDAKVMVSVRGAGITGVHKARMLPTPGFVIVNTNDDGDNRKHGEDKGTDKKEKERKQEEMKMLQGICNLVHFFLAAFSADFVTKERQFSTETENCNNNDYLCQQSSQSCRRL